MSVTRRNPVAGRAPRRRRMLAVVVAAVLALPGCALATDDSWMPHGWGPDAVVLTTAPEPVDAASLGALTGQRLRNDAVGVQARFALLPGGAPVNERLVGAVRDAVNGRAAAVGASYSPQAAPPGGGMGDRMCVRGSTIRPAAELLADPALGPPGGAGTAVACDVVAATGPIFGERLRVVTGSGAGVEADASSILYTDVTSGAVATAAELWLPDAPAQLWTALVEALHRAAGALSLAPVAAPDEAALAAFAPALATTVPGADGMLVLTVPAGFTAPELDALGVAPAAEPLTVGVPAALATTLTTPVGAALAAAAATAAPFQTPAPVPAGDTPVDCHLLPCVAMTYDDGPSGLTGGILDALAARHGAATFFVLGSRAGGYADVMRRAIAEGSQVENHSWNHPHLPQIPLDAALRQIRDTSGAIESVTGEHVTMFRPPYGEYTAAILGAAGMPAILWDVDTLDWEGPADDELTRRAVEQPRPGSIVLQHDVHENTGRTAGAVYDGLLDRGFSLVTVTQLFSGALPASGAWRSAR